MATLILNKEEAQRIVYEDHNDWSTIEREIIDTSRWSIIEEGVFEHTPTGKFYSVGWSSGATEMQDESPFEYDGDEIEFNEVEQVEVMVKKWVPKK